MTTGMRSDPMDATPTSETERRPDLNVQRIMHAIPHRYPFLMIDRVTDVVLNHSAVGIKNVSIN